MCHEVASGPVSDSPSPTTAATIKSGLSKRSSAGMRKHVPQFASFVDRTGSLRRAVTADAAGKRELFEELK